MEVTITRRLWVDGAWQDVEFVVTLDVDKIPVPMYQKARSKGKATVAHGALKVVKK